MITLAIDTSLAVVELGVYKLSEKSKKPDKLYHSYITPKSYPIRIENILPKELKKITKKINKNPDLVVINLGPGSYTSLRAGLSFVNGWWMGSKEKFAVVGVNGLKAIEAIAGKNTLTGQEERNNRVWTKEGIITREEWDKKPSKTKVFRALPKNSSVVIIGKQKIAMSEIIAYIGIRKYLKTKTHNPLNLKPIYNNKKY